MFRPRLHVSCAPVAVTVSVLAAVLVVPAAPAAAEPATPAAPAGRGATVAAAASVASATPLPTTQVDGVVWAQTTVGTTVYAVGSFSSARPARAARGTGETPRGNILAYDIRTGVLSTTFVHTLNAQAKTIVASADGSRVYVGGQFTTVDGQSRPGSPPSPPPAARAAVLQPATQLHGRGHHGDGLDGLVRRVVRERRRRRPHPARRDRHLRDAAAVGADGGRHGPGAGRRPRELPGLRGGVVLDVQRRREPRGVGRRRDVGRHDRGAGDEPDPRDRRQLDVGRRLHAAHRRHAHLRRRLPLPEVVGGPVRGDVRARPGVRQHRVGQRLLGRHLRHRAGGGDPLRREPRPRLHGGRVFRDTGAHHYGLAYGVDASSRHNVRDGRGRDYSRSPTSTLTSWRPRFAQGSVAGQGVWSFTGNGSFLAAGGEFPSVDGVASQGLVRFAIG